MHCSRAWDAVRKRLRANQTADLKGWKLQILSIVAYVVVLFERSLIDLAVSCHARQRKCAGLLPCFDLAFKLTSTVAIATIALIKCTISVSK